MSVKKGKGSKSKKYYIKGHTPKQGIKTIKKLLKEDKNNNQGEK